MWAQDRTPPQAVTHEEPRCRASSSSDNWENLSCPQALHTSAGQTQEGGQACSGTWVFPRALLDWPASPRLPPWTQGPSLWPRPHWLEGPASQCCLCAGEAVRAGWGAAGTPHRAFVSSLRDRLPRLVLKLPPALARAASPTFPSQPQLVQEPSKQNQVWPPHFLCTPDLPLGSDLKKLFLVKGVLQDVQGPEGTAAAPPA